MLYHELHEARPVPAPEGYLPATRTAAYYRMTQHTLLVFSFVDYFLNSPDNSVDFLCSTG